MSKIPTGLHRTISHDHHFETWRTELAALAPEIPRTPLNTWHLFRRFAGLYQHLLAQPRSVRRRTQRQCKHSLSRVALLLTLGMGHMLPASAADIWVTALSPDTDPTDGKCSLIEAIENANADARVNADCQRGNGADTIHLQRNKVYTLTKVIGDPVTHHSNGLPVIRSQILIDGRGSVIERKVTDLSKVTLDSDGHLSRDSNGNVSNTEPGYQLFETDVSGNLEIRNATLRGGGSFFYWADYWLGYFIDGGNITAGAIYNAGKVTLRNSFASSEYGHPTLLNGQSANMVISNSTISGGSFSVDNNSILTLNNSTVTGPPPNEQSFGGGVRNSNASSRATITNCTIQPSGGIYNDVGLYNYQGEMSVIHSTLSGNDVAIENRGDLTLSNNVISGNGGYRFGSIWPVIHNDGTIASDHNVLGDSSKALFCCSSSYTSSYLSINFTPDPSDIVATIDGNRPTALSDIIQTDSSNLINGRARPYLADNGGPTETIALVPGSPAIDAADGTNCPPTDQRGITRPQGAGCDIGAFELEVPSVSQLSAGDQTVAENTGTANVTVTLSPASTDTVTVNYATKPGTALPGQDYHGKSGTLIFNPGDTTKVIAVKIINDTVPEPTESFIFRLSAPTNATFANSDAMVTINDDDAIGPVSLSMHDLTVPESVGTANVKVTLNHASSQTVSVTYATRKATALPGHDYRGKQGTLTFNPGETTKFIPVTIINDQVPEPTETFGVKLYTPVNATIADVQATVTITDGD